YESYNVDADKNIAARMFSDAMALKDKHRIETITKRNFSSDAAAAGFIKNAIDNSKLNSAESLYSSVLRDANTLVSYSDDILTIQQELDAEHSVFKDELKRREGVLNRLMGDYVAVKEVFQSKNFIPDANSTLRLTFGNIKGYSPRSE